MADIQAAAPAAVPPRPDGAKRVPGFVRDLDTMIRARYPLIYLVSWEEQRLDVILEDLARNHGRTLFSWSVTQGLRKIDGARPIPPSDGTKSAIEVLTHIRKLNEPALVAIKDFQSFLGDPLVVRTLRELC